MGCRYMDSCPCRSGWCDRKIIDHDQCKFFLIKAYERIEAELERSEDKAARQQDTINKIRRMCDGKE